jgi:hypothetical protein
MSLPIVFETAQVHLERATEKRIGPGIALADVCSPYHVPNARRDLETGWTVALGLAEQLRFG